MSEVQAWDFLLLCLREEAAFDALKRDAILFEVSKRLLAERPYKWKSSQAVVQTIERFSLRHRAKVRSWRLDQLTRASGEDLRAVVALSFGRQEELLEALKDRADKKAVAGDLLEFWPGSAVGSWAARWVVDPKMACSLAALPVDLVAVQALASLASGDAAGAVLAAVANQQIRASVSFGTQASQSATGVAEYQRPDGARGLPLRVKLEPVGWVLEIFPSWFQNSSQPKAGSNFETSRYFARDFVRDFIRDFDLGFARSFARYFDRYFVQSFARDFDLDLEFARYFGRYFDVDFVWYFSLDSVRDFVQEFDRYFVHYSGRYVALDFAERPRVPVVRPNEPATHPHRKAWADFLAGPSDEKIARAAFEATTLRRAAEAWIALVTTSQRSREEAEAYFTYRLQYVSLLYLWPALDAKLAADPDPARLALYLQLGWTQSTTTHEWPGTERWIALMKAEPPAHWWPRAHWHLCWLLHDTAGNPEHQKGFNAALTEGLRDPDPDHLRVAETLKELIGFF